MNPLLSLAFSVVYAQESVEISFQPKESYPLVWAARSFSVTGKAKTGDCGQAVADAIRKAERPPALASVPELKFAQWTPLEVEGKHTGSAETTLCELNKRGTATVQLKGLTAALPVDANFKALELSHEDVVRVATVLERRGHKLSVVNRKPYVMVRASAGKKVDITAANTTAPQRASLVFEMLVTDRTLLDAIKLANSLAPWVEGVTLRLDSVDFPTATGIGKETYNISVDLAEAKRAASNYDQIGEVVRGAIVMVDLNALDQSVEWSRVVPDTSVLGGQRTPPPQVATAPAPVADSSDDLPTKLMKLKLVLDAGLITQQEFDAKKQQLLDEM